MPSTEYLPIATGGGALVDTQAAFSGSGYQTAGFQAGIAQPAQANKCWRQSSMMAAAIANVMVTLLGQNVPDDGNLTNLIAQVTALLQIGSNQRVAVTFSATPVFDASKGNVFEITLTGNVTAPTLVNTIPGQSLTFIVHQDGTGSRTFANPGNLPLSTIDPAVNATSVQTFIVGASAIYPDGAMTVS